MNLWGRWRQFLKPAVAVAFDRERLWCIATGESEVSVTPALVAIDRTKRKVVAIGDEAVQLRGNPPANLAMCDYIREGSITDFNVAEAAVRYELKKRQGSVWRLPPRVLVATRQDEIAKRAMRDVVMHAGARDLVTIPTLMAGAIGAGLEFEAGRPPATVFLLDRDWAGFAVIQSNAMVASHEIAGGVEEMLLDVAARTRLSPRSAVADLQAMHTLFRRSGISENEGDAGHRLFILRWRERFFQAIASLPATTRRDLQRSPLCLVGPYAKIPGLREIFTSSWEWQAIAPQEPERAVIFGCQKILGELDRLIWSAK